MFVDLRNSEPNRLSYGMYEEFAQCFIVKVEDERWIKDKSLYISDKRK